MGVIDCTDDCPGTEDEFKHFQEVMEDKDFAKKYPKIAAMAKKKPKDKAKMEHKSEEAEPEPEPVKDKGPDVKQQFLQSLRNCKSFSSETMALFTLVTVNMYSFVYILLDIIYEYIIYYLRRYR